MRRVRAEYTRRNPDDSMGTLAILAVAGYVAYQQGWLSTLLPSIPPPSTGPGGSRNGSLTWSQAAPLPNPRNYTGAAASSSRLYCAGGLQDGEPSFTPYVDEYNPISNTWTRLPDMPIGRIAHGVEVVGNYLYVLSGFTSASPADPSCYRINLSTPLAWERIADIPVGRRDFGTAVAGPLIYVIGGNIDDARSVMTDVHCYNTNTGAWTPVAPLNVGRRYVLTGGVPDGSLGAFGGVDNHGTNVVEAFDPGTNSWVVSALTTPNSVFSGQAVYVEPYWYLLCGKQANVASGAVMQLDARSHQWTSPGPASAPTARADFGAAVLGGKIYLVGGTNGSGARTAAVDVATIG